MRNLTIWGLLSRKGKSWPGALGAWLLLVGPVLAQTSAPVEGIWQSPQKSEISIEPCRGGYCGYLTRIIPTEDYAADCERDPVAFEAALTDRFNPDPALRGRPLPGLKILSLRLTPNPAVFEGEIYNAGDGNTYPGQVEVIGADHIRLGGLCVFGVCAQTQDWLRAPVHADEAMLSCRAG